MHFEVRRCLRHTQNLPKTVVATTPSPNRIHRQNGEPHSWRGLRHKRFSASLSVGGLTPLSRGIERVILKGTDNMDILAKSDSGVARAQTDCQ